MSGWFVAAFLACATPLAADTPRVEVEGRIDALIAAMTLDEKLGQLTQQWGGAVQDVNPATTQQKFSELEQSIRDGKVGSLLGAHGAEYTNRLQRVAVEESRHRIPILLGNDVIHGYRTIFPIPLAESCSWDLGLVERAAAVAAREARAAGTHWTFAPMVDICRDPRWGRVAEGAGEDPYLGGTLAAARIRGFQGTDPAAPDRVLACAKHFAAYGGAEGGRDYNTVDISERALREIFLPPFRAAVDAGAASLMSAFNDISGVPASASPLLLRRILREEWGFKGFVVSDWNSVGELVPHGFAADGCAAAAKAVVAGVDMDMCSFTYRDCLADAVKRERVPAGAVDEAVRRVLRAKFRAGLFDRPYADARREAEVTLSAEHRSVARDMARASIVLLKNEGGLLPIPTGARTLAVIGPMAQDQKNALGTWAAIGKAEEVVSAIDGIRRRAGESVEIRYAEGCGLSGDSQAGFDAAIAAARGAELAIVIVGEGEDQSGEGHSRSSLDLPGVQGQLVLRLKEAGTPLAVVVMSGRPLALGPVAESAGALVQAWHLGTEGGNALADVLFGDFSPGGKLCITFPRNVGQIPLYYAHRNTGRPPKEGERYTSQYIDVPWTPLYPFGYGLSYTTFEYSDLRVEPIQIGRDQTLTVRATVKNTGQRAGHEVAQLYVRDPVASVTQPVKRLEGFQRVLLKPGEARTLEFEVRPEQLSLYDQEMRLVLEPGDFQVWVGPSSAEGLQGAFAVSADSTTRKGGS